MFISIVAILLTFFNAPAEEQIPRPKLHNFSYSEVQVTRGPMAAQEKEARDFFLALNEDSLLKGFRARAGLPAPGSPMGGWYDPEDFAGGHSFGQYLSALARYYANTGDPRFQRKVARLVHGFHETLAADGFFYSSAKVAKEWPCYLYDKNATGMRDAFTLTGNTEALTVLSRMTDWADTHLPRRSDEWYTLSQGLLLDYELTEEPRYLRMAKEFDYSPGFFDAFAAGENAFTPERHAYSHVNSLSSAFETYRVTGISKYFQALKNAWQFLTSTQTFPTGGWGPDEHFVGSDSARLEKSLQNTTHHFETPCGSYANVNFSRGLLGLTGESKFADNIEKVLLNGMLASLPMRPDGKTFYYSDYSAGTKKDYFPAVWPCCSGTYAQITADYPLDIYFHDDNGIYIGLFAESSVRWKVQSSIVTLKQETDFPLSDKTKIILHVSKPAKFTVHVRVPNWLTQTATVALNGRRLSIPTRPGTFLDITETWKNGDRLELIFPRSLHFEFVSKDSRERAALMYGPLVLAALAVSDIELKGDIGHPEQWIQPVKNSRLDFISRDGIVFRPIYLIKNEHYTTFPRILADRVATR